MSKDFKVKINRQAIAEISTKTLDHNLLIPLIRSGAPSEDIETASVLLALTAYLQERRCEPDFELVLNE